MRMFRSMRNPVTKTGRTSNTTGSRVRTSARTIREQTGNLVQNARKKISMSSPALGYKHATSPRTVKGSAAASGENARKSSYNQGQTTEQGRAASYSAIKTAKAPSGAPLGYKAGYAVGARVAASKYKQNIQIKTGTRQPYSHIQGGSYPVSKGRTGLESRLQTYVAAAGNQARRFAGNLLRNNPAGPMHIQRPVSNSPVFDRNKAASVLASIKSAAGRVAAGAKAGYRMPNASIRQAYDAQRFSRSASFAGHAPVALASRGMAGSFAAGYGVGKLAKRAVQAPGKAYKTGQKVTFGIQDALGGVGRGFKYAAQGNIQTAKYATMNAANAAYRGDSKADRFAGRIVNPIELGLQAAGKPLVAAANYVEGRVRSMAEAKAAAAAKNKAWGGKAPNWSAVYRPAQSTPTTWGGKTPNWSAVYRPSTTTPPQQPKPASKPAPQTAKAAAKPRTAKPQAGRVRAQGQRRYVANTRSYNSNIASGQQHPLRAKGKASAPTASPTASPAANTSQAARPAKPTMPHGHMDQQNRNIAHYARNIAANRDRWDTTKGYEGFTRTEEEKLRSSIRFREQTKQSFRPDNADEIKSAGAKKTSDLVARLRDKRSRAATPVAANRERLDAIKSHEALTLQVKKALKSTIMLRELVKQDLRPDNAEELKAAGAKRTSDLVARIRDNRSRAATPTTVTQGTLLNEEPQPRRRGQRGPDKNPRKPRKPGK